MRIFKQVPNFDFFSKGRYAAALSIILVTTSIGSLIYQGLNLGLDFKGGIQIEVGYPKEISAETVRKQLAAAGFDDVVVQSIGETGKDLTISIADKGTVTKAEVSNKVIDTLQKAGNEKIDVRRRDFVGSKVGKELRDKGGIAMLLALGGIMIYVMFRFEWRFSLGAIVATIHDVLITIGFFSVFQWPFDLTVLAAVLAIIGYSLNDTVVVYDRIRENFRKMRKGTTLEITNAAMNQTLSRTVMTSFTTLLVVSAMYFFGGPSIQPFSLALIIGIIVGTYSSIYVASAMVLALKVDRSHLMPTPKQTEGDGSHP
ncbi:MAG: protein translocase subunit SecF [Gammaproteobacteria bacterium]|nr:protein translocase subunit SecF [Gammaproteobacteria bacterium]